MSRCETITIYGSHINSSAKLSSSEVKSDCTDWQKHTYAARTMAVRREEVVMPRLHLHSHSCTRDNISTTVCTERVRVKAACEAIYDDASVFERSQSCMTGFVVDVMERTHTGTPNYHPHASIIHIVYAHKSLSYIHRRRIHTYASPECGLRVMKEEAQEQGGGGTPEKGVKRLRRRGGKVEDGQDTDNWDRLRPCSNQGLYFI